MVAVPSARFFFDAGSGIVLWAADDETRQQWDYPLDLDDLPVSDELRAGLADLLDRNDVSFNWAEPSGPGPWREDDCRVFVEDARAWLDRARAELGPGWLIRDEMYEPHEDPGLDRYLADPHCHPPRSLARRIADLDAAVTMTAPMRTLVAQANLPHATGSELAPGAASVLTGGWIHQHRGPQLVRRHLQTFHGRGPDEFDDTTAYEAAVNGRAVDDFDLADDDTKPVRLLCRAVALSVSLLELLRADSPPTTAAIGIAQNPQRQWTGYQWFWSEHPGEKPHFTVDPDSDRELLMTMSLSAAALARFSRMTRDVH